MTRKENGLCQEIEERIGPGKILLMGEPILKPPEDETGSAVFNIPKGFEEWVLGVAGQNLSNEEKGLILGDEYLSIVQTLQFCDIPVGFLGAHDKLWDKTLVVILKQEMGLKGYGFFREIPLQYSSFPRDMMLSLGERLVINPKANLSPQREDLELSLIGEGGVLLNVDSKVLLTDLIADPQIHSNRKKRRAYEAELRGLTQRYQVGFLPWPVGVRVDLSDGCSVKKQEFPSTHLDRVAALIKGKDERDYLLVDHHYLDENRPPWGKYREVIEKVCQRLNIRLIDIVYGKNDVPYSLNFVQFRDGSIILSDGHFGLEKLLREIVGELKVFTTRRPIVLYPVLKNAGIRCLTVVVPRNIFRAKEDEKTGDNQ